MTRDSILEEVLGIKSNAIVLQLGTGVGKSKLAIKKAVSLKCKKILIVVPKLTIIESWKEEFKTWGHSKLLETTTLSTYNSLEKHVKVSWDMIIFDEAHHLTERCREILGMMCTKNIIFLSATMKRDIMEYLRIKYPNLYIYRIGMRKTIEEGVLPDPRIILVPLKLDNRLINYEIIHNPKGKTPGYICAYSQRWSYIRQKTTKVVIRCTQQEYYNDLSNQIDYYKRKGLYSERMRTKMLQLSGERLKWLARQKTAVVRGLLNLYQNERTLTFCCDIEQSNLFSSNSINSKKKESFEVLEKFNLGKIDHIQACAMLDEGVNLVNCRVGIFANINSSERIITQRNGRILRHKSPIIVLPYYKNTREEELVKKMLENYNPDLIETNFDFLKF